MPCAISIAITCIFIRLVQSGAVGDEGTLASVPSDPFDTRERNKRPARRSEKNEEAPSTKNNWGFGEGLVEWPEEDNERKEKIPKRVETTTPERVETTTQYYEEVDPNHNGLLKDIGSINVGFGVGVGVPGNDPVSVGARVGVGFGASGLAGQLPIGQNIYPRQVKIRLWIIYFSHIHEDFESSVKHIARISGSCHAYPLRL
ncbi:unnamed protein product [Cylicostephanus goldi]|uniref:Uncharacterized protein n=1 Tax=Cylicostephanus goldi TaxID=71465 RepID=A0A3P7LYK4_CYLGO|nr:unnamed protein product [Cylicostephanus goldi]